MSFTASTAQSSKPDVARNWRPNWKFRVSYWFYGFCCGAMAKWIFVTMGW